MTGSSRASLFGLGLALGLFGCARAPAAKAGEDSAGHPARNASHAAAASAPVAPPPTPESEPSAPTLGSPILTAPWPEAPVSGSGPSELAARFGARGLAARAKLSNVLLTTSGDGAHRFVLLEPIGEAHPRHVVLFFHGWDGVNPRFYGAWLDYLARQDLVVVFVGYQREHDDVPAAITEVAHAAILAALTELGRPGHSALDLASLVSIGYSMGASVALNLALPDRFPDLPRSRGLLLVNPADGFSVASGKAGGSILLEIERLPLDTRVVLAIADADPLAVQGARLYRRLCRLPSAQRNLVTLHSDDHGSPALKADHLAPSAYSRALDFDPSVRVSQLLSTRPLPWASAQIDAVDTFGYWRLADGVIDATFSGKTSDAAFGSSAALRFAGLWPDGTPIRPLEVDHKTCSP